MRMKRERTYGVRWEIEVDATSAREAAEKALEIQRDPNSIATVFSVGATFDDRSRVEIDLRPVPSGPPDVVPPVGTMRGPCHDRRCGESDCTKMRMVVAALCTMCESPIGYARGFCEANGGLAHSSCVDAGIRARQAQGARGTRRKAKAHRPSPEKA